MIEIDQQKTTASGVFNFDTHEVASNAGLQTASDFNHGVVNFQVVGVTPDSSGEQNFSKSISSEASESLPEAIRRRPEHRL